MNNTDEETNFIQKLFGRDQDRKGRKEMEEELRTASHYARSLIEANLDPLVTISPDGKITDVNEATIKATGVQRENLIGSDFSEYFTEPGKAAAGYRKVLTDGFVRDYPLTLRHTSGRTIDVLYNANVYRNAKGELQGVFAAARDITDQKKAHEEQFRLAAIVEYSNDGIIGKTLEGVIFSWNTGAEKMYGYSAKEIIGKHISILLPPDHQDEIVQIIEKIRKGETILRQETVRKRKDGVIIDVSLTLSPIKDSEGRLVGISTIAQDVTLRRKMEEDLKKYRDQLEDMVKVRTAALTQVLQEIQETINILTTSSSQILSSATELAASVSQTASSVAETTTTVEEVKQTADLASQKARMVADNAQQASTVAQNGQRAVEDVMGGMHKVQEQMESIASNVVRLSEQSQAVGEIIVTVNDIAEQSNILAINASIEAAKAGEFGKGFGVVAQEIRNLADQSKQATAQVRTILTDIQRGVSAAVMATEQGSRTVNENLKQSTAAGESIRVLTGTIAESAKAATQIAASSQQQNVGMTQVASSMEDIKRASQQNLVGTQQSESAARSLHDLGFKLKQIAERYQV